MPRPGGLSQTEDGLRGPTGWEKVHTAGREAQARGCRGSQHLDRGGAAVSPSFPQWPWESSGAFEGRSGVSRFAHSILGDGLEWARLKSGRPVGRQSGQGSRAVSVEMWGLAVSAGMEHRRYGGMNLVTD